MDKLKHFLTIIILLMLVFCAKHSAQAEDLLKKSLDNLINESGLSKTSVVSISVKEAETGITAYERDGNLLLHPASTLKAFTTPVILKHLGSNNQIKTGFYRFKDDFYLKLSGDPLLTSEDLSFLFKKVKDSGINCIKNLIIDDTAIDNIPWGVGWMWDDENNPYMPKYSTYNLDSNLIKVKVIPSKKNAKLDILVMPYFPVKIINKAVIGDKNNLIIERRTWLNPETIYISGTISSPQEKIIPIGNPQKYFTYRLEQAIKTNEIKFGKKVKTGKIPSEAVLIEEINHNVIDEVRNINQKSNNLAAETLFKVAGGKYSGSTGRTKDGLKAFRQFYTDLGADTSELFIVDGSGVSHNDLIQTNWMSLALSKLYNQPEFDCYLNTLAVPDSKSTITDRFDNLSERLWAKTGTLAGVSGITGYLKADSGKTYTFAILIQNYKGTSVPFKKLEDKIINTLAKF